MRYSIKLLTIIFIVLFISSCHDNINKRLQLADAYLNHNQIDSAYNILKNIDADMLENKEDIALYTLLYTETKYKKYIPVKNDSIDYAVFYYEQSDNQKRLLEAYNYKAMTLYYDQKKIKEAIICLKKGESIATVKNYGRHNQQLFENISVVNFDGQNYEIALKYGKKALYYANQMKDSLSIAYDICYVSDSYSALGMEDYAMQYYLKALPFMKYYNKQNQSILLGNIGEYYFEKGNIEKAEEYLKKAFKMLPTAYAYSIIADIYIKNGKYTKAKELMEKVPVPITDIAKHKVLSTLYDINRKSEDYKQALDIADSIIVFNHAMDSVKEHQNLNEIQAKFDRERAAQEFETRMVYIVGGLVLLTLLVLSFMFRQKYRVTKMRHDMMQNRLLINEYTDKITEMEKEHSDSTMQIKELKKKVSNLESAEAKTLFNGKRCYEAIRSDNSIVKWKVQDFRDFIDYYSLMDLPYVSGLEEEYGKLTPRQILYMIMVNRMSKDDKVVEDIMGVSSSTIRSMKSRINAKKHV